MKAVEIICGLIMLIASLVIVVLVAVQESPKSGGISALTGGDSFFSKNKGRTRDVILVKITKVAVAFFFVSTIVAYAIMARMA